MKSLTGAILIHAGCTMATAEGLMNDPWFIPVIAGILYLVWGFASAESTSETKPSGSK